MRARTNSFFIFVMVMLGLCSCADFKEFDADAGLLAVPNVYSVKINGRHHIRLVGKNSVALIDPVGGHVVEFYLQRRARFQLFEDEAKKIQFPAGPNVLTNDGKSVTPGQTGSAGGPDTLRYWQSEGWGVGIIMVSDRYEKIGPFHKQFELNDDGTLQVRVVDSSASVEKPVFVPFPVGETRKDERGQTITREVQLDNNGKGWSEKWTITPAAVTTQPNGSF